MNAKHLLIGAVAGALLLTGCGSSSGSGGSGGKSGKGGTLTWETTGGDATKYESAAFQVPFTAKTGVKFNNVTSLSYISQLQTMVKSKKTVWDVVHTGSYLAKFYCGKLFEKLDTSKMPVNLVPEGTTTDCSVPAVKYGTAFAYDTTVYKDKVPTKIGDFFDTKTFPGKRVVYANSPMGILEAALVADGVAPDKLYPLDIDRGLKKLSTIKSSLIFAPSFTAVQQDLVNKQATMTITLTGRLNIINESGAKLAPVWDFTSWDYDSFVVPMGSAHKATAEQVVAFGLEPAQLIDYAERSGLTPVRSDIDPTTINFSEAGKKFNPFVGSGRGTVQLRDPAYWADNFISVTKKWLAWQVG